MVSHPSQRRQVCDTSSMDSALDDLRRMIYMLVGTVTLDLSKADLDGDGQLLLADLQVLVRILVGIP